MSLPIKRWFAGSYLGAVFGAGTATNLFRLRRMFPIPVLDQPTVMRALSGRHLEPTVSVLLGGMGRATFLRTESENHLTARFKAGPIQGGSYPLDISRAKDATFETVLECSGAYDRPELSDEISPCDYVTRACPAFKLNELPNALMTATNQLTDTIQGEASGPKFSRPGAIDSPRRSKWWPTKGPAQTKYFYIS